MKTDTSANGYFSNLLIPGTILLANIDVSGLVVYGLKATIGGAIWLAFKVAGDYLEDVRKQPKGKQKSNPFRFFRRKKDNQ